MKPVVVNIEQYLRNRERKLFAGEMRKLWGRSAWIKPLRPLPPRDDRTLRQAHTGDHRLGRLNRPSSR